MGFYDTYISTSDSTANGNPEDKIVLSDDAYAQAEMIYKLCKEISFRIGNK